MVTSSKRLEDVIKTYLRNVLKTSWQDVLKMSWRLLENVFKTSRGCHQDVFARRLEDVLKTSWRCLGKTSWRCLEDASKTSWKRLEEVMVKRLEDVLKTSWKRLEDVLKTYGQDKYIGLDQDVFWRRKARANIFVLIKTSSRHLHQYECLLGYIHVFIYIHSVSLVNNKTRYQ